MGYYIEKGRLYQKDGVGVFGYKKFDSTFATTLDEAKEKFKEYAGVLPQWLELLKDPDEYLQESIEIEEDGQPQGLIVAIVGDETTTLVGEEVN